MAVQRSNKPASAKAHPVSQALRAEMNRQRISSYRMAKLIRSYPSSMTRMWSGEWVPTVPIIERIIAVLRRDNPDFRITL